MSLTKIPVLFFLISLFFNCSDPLNRAAGRKDLKNFKMILMQSEDVIGRIGESFIGIGEKIKDKGKAIGAIRQNLEDRKNEAIKYALGQIEAARKDLVLKIAEINSKVDSFDGTDAHHQSIQNLIEVVELNVKSFAEKVRNFLASHKIEGVKGRFRSRIGALNNLLEKLVGLVRQADPDDSPIVFPTDDGSSIVPPAIVLAEGTVVPVALPAADGLAEGTVVPVALPAADGLAESTVVSTSSVAASGSVISDPVEGADAYPGTYEDIPVEEAVAN